MFRWQNTIAILSLVAIAGACVAEPASVSTVKEPQPTITPSVASSTTAPSLLPLPALVPTPATATPSNPPSEPPVTARPAGATPQMLVTPRLGASATVLANGARTQHVIAITFDDCWSASAVRADLAILERNHVNATWFPIGRAAVEAPDTWRAVAAAGYPVANHTYDHLTLTTLSYAAAVNEIHKDNMVVGQLIGEPLLPIVRPPGGAWNSMVVAASTSAGERVIALWDTTDGDTGRPFNDIPLIERNAERGTNGSILLMHANLPYAQQALPSIIAFYRARGYAFVTLGQMFGLPGPIPFPND